MLKTNSNLRPCPLAGFLGCLLFLSACEPGKPSANQGEVSQGKTLTVFAAASTSNAVEELAVIFKEQTGIVLVTSFASSSTLAKQIDQGAPADVFISANSKWVDYLEEADKLHGSGRLDLLGNRMVLIAPNASSVASVEIRPGLDLPGLLGEGRRLGMGDPEHVPAGIYGKQALESLGLWDSVASRIAPMADVRAALAMVERGETPLGIVYATDAAMSERVKTIGVFPEDSHPPIIYPLAQVSQAAGEAASLFTKFLKGPEAGEVFKKYGFKLIKSSPEGK